MLERMGLGSLRIAQVMLVAAPLLSGRGGTVWVVDDDAGAGVDFTTLQAAVDAASDGDAILVRPGSYAPFAVDGKGLSIVGEEGAVVDTWPDAFVSVQVANLDASEWFLLLGLDLERAGTLGVAIRLEGNAGNVWLEDVAVTGQGASAAVVQECASVVIVRCEFTSVAFALLPDFVFGGSAGLFAQDSSVALYESVATGSKGAPNSHPFACVLADDGGAGLATSGGDVFVSGSTLRGGEGGDGVEVPVTFVGAGGDGGAGLDVQASTASALVVDTTLEAGEGGTGASCPGGNPGPPFCDPGAVLSFASGVARSVRSTTPLLEGAAGVLDFEGDDADFVVLGISKTAYLFPLPGALGPLDILPATTFAIGSLPPGGTTSLPFTADDLGSGVDFAVWYGQAAFAGLDATIRFGAPFAAVFLDEAYGF